MQIEAIAGKRPGWLGEEVVGGALNCHFEVPPCLDCFIASQRPCQAGGLVSVSARNTVDNEVFIAGGQYLGKGFEVIKSPKKTSPVFVIRKISVFSCEGRENSPKSMVFDQIGHCENL